MAFMSNLPSFYFDLGLKKSSFVTFPRVFFRTFAENIFYPGLLFSVPLLVQGLKGILNIQLIETQM